MSSSTNGKKSLLKKLLFVFVPIFAAGIIFAGLFNMGLTATNEMEFCTSCHTMVINYDEYIDTPHGKSPSGVRATCSDCHVPKQFFPKMLMKIMAAKDVYHEILGTIDTPEKYEAARWKMANRVWDKMKANDSRECRSCHSYENMDLAAQDRSARRKHGNATDKGKTCIDCHKGIAHEEPDEPDEAEETASE
ncbi:MAG: NapC/NirT family cytochrome c [Sedimenticola sp.]